MKVEEEFFDDVELEGSEQLEMFLNVIWPDVKKYKYSMHEQFKTFVCKNASATVKLDYLCSDKNDNRVLIYDWKTGKSKDDYNTSLQVGAYVLWITKDWNKKLERVEANLVYLKTGTVRTYLFTNKDLGEFENTIVTDFNAMNESYDKSYFTPSPDSMKCAKCTFGTYCDSSALNDYLGLKGEIEKTPWD